MVPSYSNNQTGHHQQQHSFSHSATQRNQNRSFQYGEQQGNHQPFFKNNHHYRNHDRNNQQHYHYYHHPQGMNGLINSDECDEYAGLMSNREKQWLINIQLLQLNTNEPYVDDYYYTVFCDKKNKQDTNQDQKDRKHHNNNNNNGYHRDSRYTVLSSVGFTFFLVSSLLKHLNRHLITLLAGIATNLIWCCRRQYIRHRNLRIL